MDETNRTGLETRLDRLALETDTCSLGEFQEMADRIRSGTRFERALDRAQALSNEKRLVTLKLLEERGELCACEIQAALGCTNATVSHHMSLLVEAELVSAAKRGKWKHYALTDEGTQVLEQVCA